MLKDSVDYFLWRELYRSVCSRVCVVCVFVCVYVCGVFVCVHLHKCMVVCIYVCCAHNFFCTSEENIKTAVSKITGVSYSQKIVSVIIRSI